MARTPEATDFNAGDPTGDFVVTLDCPDRPGIVHAVSGFLVEHGGNIVESQQFFDRLNGRFFMRIDFAMADGNATAESLRAASPRWRSGSRCPSRSGRAGAVPHPDHGQQAPPLPQRPALPRTPRAA